MEIEEFKEKHPGAKEMILEPNGLVYNRKEPLMTINNIHETQLDKQKVFDAINNPLICDLESYNKLKYELRLHTSKQIRKKRLR